MANRETVELGTLNLGSEVFVSDPCYSVDTWCAKKIENMKPGKYVAKMDIGDCGRWGKRVASLRIFHEDYQDENENFPERLISDEIGVDSGQCGFWDYKRFAKEKADRIGAETFYERVCDITQSDAHGGIDVFGVVSSTGFGDGCYSVYAGYAEDGSCISLEVEFLTEEDLEDEESYDE